MIRLRGLSLAVLAVLLLVAVLPILMTTASADAVYLKVIRYDGVNSNLYDPCYASYGIEVVGAEEDDEVTYRWQVNVAGIVGSHEWLEASDCTWTWDYFSPVITVRLREDYHTATPPNRFCLRCIVKVNGEEYLSPVFEIITHERHNFDNVAVIDVAVPEAGKKPNTSGRFESEHLTLGPVTWYAVGSDGAYKKMGSGETFADGRNYAVEIRGTMEKAQTILDQFDGETVDKFKQTMESLSETSQQARVLLQKLKDSGLDSFASNIKSLNEALDGLLKYFRR